MKALQINRNLQRILALVLISILPATALMAQDNKTKKQEKAAAVKAMIDAQRYTFRAQTALPMRGRTVQLTTDYTVKVTKDTVVADLPYFGRSFTAPIDPSKGGIQFNSTKFDYKVTEIRKGWQVIIKPTDASDVQQLNLTIFNNGSASLQVTNTNRTPISFNGQLVEKK